MVASTEDPTTAAADNYHPSVFVTVGTTQFDGLIKAVTSREFLTSLSHRGYKSITIQYGRGQPPSFQNLTTTCSKEEDTITNDDIINCTVSIPTTKKGGDGDVHNNTHTMKCHAYRFKPTLHDDLSSASLILSHAGAGSIMEGLSTPKGKLVVVINSKLMDDHQKELADAMGSRNYLFVVTDPVLLRKDEVVQEIEDFRPIVYPGGDGGKDFVDIVDHQMGFLRED